MLISSEMMYKKLLGIISIASFPFLFSLQGDFVFDDSEAVIKNKDVTSESWLYPFYNDFWGTSINSNLSHKSYRPLTILSFRLNYFLSGKKFIALNFKITNLICHVTCCILVWATFENILKGVGVTAVKHKGNRLDDNSSTAYLAALLFAVHPVHAEAVCGIVGRADLLAAITFFLAFLSYDCAIVNPRYSYLYLSATIILAAVSMLCKENGITVLGFCLSYEIVNNCKIKRKIIKTKTKKTFCEILTGIDVCVETILRIFIIITAAILLLYGRWIIMGRKKPEFKPIDNPAAFTNDFFKKTVNYNYIYFLNLVLFLWPQWLCYDWSMGCVPLIETLFDYRIMFTLVMYLYGILLILAIINRNNRGTTKRVIILAVSLIVIPFLPATNILYPVGFVIAERILYIPSSGYCLLVATGLSKIIHLKRINRYKIWSLLLIIYILRSWQRSYDWQNEYQLFTTGLSVCPLNAKVHYNVAKVADSRHRTEWALWEYREAIRLYPEYYQAMNNLANLLKNNKQYSEAESYLRAAISYKREFPAAWMNLGIVLASMKHYAESHDAYKTALNYRKSYPDCYYNLGNLYLQMNRTKEAIENWYLAVNINPKHVLAWTNLLALLDNSGQLEKALEIIPKALNELPDAASVNFAVANIYGKVDQFKDAEIHFIKAIKLFGNKVQAIHYANLGVLYHRWKKYDAAEAMYQKALKRNPSFKSAHNNLKSLQKLILKEGIK